MRAKQHTLGRRLITAVMSMAVVVTLYPAGASARSASPVVMTRNVYLGADLIPVILAPDAPSLFQAAADVFVNVNATNFPARAELLAQEIADSSPDLIGLQEVALWRTGTLFDPAPATTVAYDFLALLQAELSDLGEGYTAAVVQSTFDGEVPATLSAGGIQVFRDVRLTQRNVILVRSGVSYTNARAGYFEINTVIPDVGGITGNDVVDLRGWVSIDVTMEPKEKTFRFVNTHLESFVTPIRDVQAKELVAGPLNTALKVIAVGDFNSPPTGPESGAYSILTSPEKGRLDDAWAVNGTDPGYTFGQAADLLNPTSTASVRIDHVLGSMGSVKPVSAWLTGTTARTSGGLWASDHFGVVAEVSLP